MLIWGVLHETGVAVCRTRSGPLAGAATAAAAYAIDYHVVPPRLAPGIEKRLSKRGVFMSYATMASTLAASRLWNSPAEANGADE
jgi:hypothetical protein